eukprot:7372064-Lingulodinium_polyedra.AAC.1
MGICSITQGVGLDKDIVTKTYVPAAWGIAKRRGAGKARRSAWHHLWLQEKVNKGEVEVRKVRSEDHIVGVSTKHVDKD